MRDNLSGTTQDMSPGLRDDNTPSLKGGCPVSSSLSLRPRRGTTNGGCDARRWHLPRVEHDDGTSLPLFDEPTLGSSRTKVKAATP
jgi:hypothetical protein